MLARAPHASRLCRAMAGGGGGAKRPRASKADAGSAAAPAAAASSSTGLWLLKSEPDERYDKGVKVCTPARLARLGSLTRLRADV